MALTLKLSPEQEDELTRKAEDRGLTIEAYVVDLLRREAPGSVPELSREERAARSAAALELLRSWVEEGDVEEQPETFEALKQGLNENHAPYRKIFP